MQPQLVGPAEGLVTLGALEDLLGMEAAHVLLHLKRERNAHFQKGADVAAQQRRVNWCTFPHTRN